MHNPNPKQRYGPACTSLFSSRKYSADVPSPKSTTRTISSQSSPIIRATVSTTQSPSVLARRMKNVRLLLEPADGEAGAGGLVSGIASAKQMPARRQAELRGESVILAENPKRHIWWRHWALTTRLMPFGGRSLALSHF